MLMALVVGTLASSKVSEGFTAETAGFASTMVVDNENFGLLAGFGRGGAGRFTA
jgi:hypothetical protein